MKARFPGVSAGARCVHLAAAFGLLLAQFAVGSASAELATLEQKRACTPDVYRLCAGKIPQRAGDHRLPAAAEDQSQRCLPGGVRAVMI